MAPLQMQRRSPCAWCIASFPLLLLLAPRGGPAGFLSGHLAIPQRSAATSSIALFNNLEYAEELQVGQEVSGTVTGFDKTGAILDLGLSLPGLLHMSKVSETERVAIRDKFSVGDKITARIMEIRREKLGRRRAEIEVSMIDVPEFHHKEIEIDAEVGQNITGTITGFNKVGAILDLGLPLRGFLHKNQISRIRPRRAEDVYSVGDEVTARITNIRKTAVRGRPPEIELTVKHAEDSQKEGSKVLKNTKVDAKIGQEVTGTVTSINEQGVDLDLGLSLPGFLHKSKISELRVEQVSDSFSVGDEVTARVREIRRVRYRGRPPAIEVSMIDVPEFHREEIKVDAQVGQEVTGTVTGFTSIGAILDLGLSVPGFLHKGKISKDRVEQASDVLSVGDKVTARIKKIRTVPSRGKLPEVEVSVIDVPEFKPKVGEEVTGTVTSIDEMGVVLDLGLSLPGFLHKSKISEKRINKVSDVFSVGDKVTARIREVRTTHERARPPEIEVSMIDLPEFHKKKVKVDVEVGQEIDGTVTGVNKDGFSLDLGLSVPGFLHKNKISKDLAEQDGDAFSVGDKVTARVTEVRTVFFRGRSPEVLVSMIT